MKKMTAAVLAALLMSPLGTSFYAACEAASTDLRVSSASSQPLPPSPPPDGMPPQGMPPQGGMGGFNPPQTVMQGTAKVTVTKAQTLTEKTYTSTGSNENALRIKGATVTLKSSKIEKLGGTSSSTEGGDFYGMNAAVLATDGAALTVEDTAITSNAPNGNALFSYGKGTKVSAQNVTIHTTGRNSGGLQTTGGASMKAVDVKVLTEGDSAAAIRSDRGGGTVRVTGGTFETKGHGSPAIYSTADIAVTGAALRAAHSEGAVIEGKNSISLTDCSLEGAMDESRLMGPKTIQEENTQGIMIYQSMSGDAEEGKSTFSMVGGSLMVHKGDVIYVTNTKCRIFLDHVDIKQEEAQKALIRVSGNSASRGWGKAGVNGGDAVITTKDQTLSGRIVTDTISKLDLTLGAGSTFTGSTQIEENRAASKADGTLSVTVEKGAVWDLTEDSVVTQLVNHGTIHKNGHTLTVKK